MKEPTHNIKLYSGNNIPCPDSTWYESAPHWYQNSAHGWLGSGITDQNGREIFEGNIVRNCFDTAEVIFRDGAFWLNGDLLATFKRDCSELEIVGHIAEETP